MAVSDRVCVLTTTRNFPLVIRGGPSTVEVKGFVTEHTKRYYEGKAAGPSGEHAFLILTAKFYSSEVDWLSGVEPVSTVNISNELLPIS